ncbi:MAG: MmgE/PrpD family protein [Dehalococcoidia bacterium]
MTTENPGAPSITSVVAELAANIRYEDLPVDVVLLAKECLLDWLGVTIAGASEPLSRILQDEMTEQGGNAQATIVGTGLRGTVQQAALVNGAASHALDYDDVHTAMSGHPTVPVAPGLLALAEWRRSSPRDFIAAFVAGFETECRIGLLVNPGHYAEGWHATGTLGTFGSAAACAHLQGLDAETMRTVIGIAAAQAAGLKSMFGTMCKPVHAGKAAANGLMAATLAARGFTSNTESLETHQGFAATHGPTFDPARALAGPANGYFIRGVLFKYHAACYGTHSSIESLLRIKETHGVTPEQVSAVHLRVPTGALSMCNIQEPVTALEGKFSLRFTSALALGHGDTSELAFTDERTADPLLVSLRDRVQVEGDAVAGGTQVTVTLTDGRVLHESVDVNIPATDLELQWERLVAKFRGLATPVIGAAATAELVDAVRRLEERPSMDALVRLSVPALAGAR